MSWLLKAPVLFSGAVAVAMGFIPAVSAQDVSDSRKMPARMIPGVRYTTGAVTSSGWEKSLTDNNPNLKRWNWSSITSYTQSSYNKVPAGSVPGNKHDVMRPGHIYTKPIQISADTYAKKRTQPVAISQGSNRANANVSGRVNFPSEIAQEPEAKSYNVNYGVAGKVKLPHHQTGSLASQQVTGRLMKTQ
jgi:hypothetical protein